MKWIICAKYLHPGEDSVSFIIWDKKESYYSLFGRDILLIMSYVFYYRCVLLGNSFLSSFINFRSSVGRTYALLCIVQWWRLICIPTTCYTFFTSHFFKRFVRQDFTRNLRRSPIIILILHFRNYGGYVWSYVSALIFLPLRLHVYASLNHCANLDAFNQAVRMKVNLDLARICKRKIYRSTKNPSYLLQIAGLRITAEQKRICGYLGFLFMLSRKKLRCHLRSFYRNAWKNGWKGTSFILIL